MIKMILIFSLWTYFVRGQDDYTKFDCGTCLEKSGRYCLFDGDFTTGSCCDPKNKITNSCKYQHLNRFCATNAFTNTFVQQFVCPASLAHCPNTKSEY